MDLEISKTRDFLTSLPTQSLLRNELTNRLDFFEENAGSIEKDVCDVRRFVDSISSPYVKRQINDQLDLIERSISASTNSICEKSVFDSVLASVDAGEEIPRGINQCFLSLFK